jgi:large conductance mechanosensitive channel
MAKKEIKIIQELNQPINFLQEFVLFIKNFGVISLAIGVIIGQTTNSLVTSIVNNLINPILGKFAGVKDLNTLVFFDIKIGAFLSDLINFLIILLILYLLIRFLIVHILTDEEKKKFSLIKENPEEINEKEKPKTKKSKAGK